MYTVEKTIAKLARVMKEHNFKEFSINMKCNGDTLVIIPMSETALTISDIKQVDYIIVKDSPKCSWLSSSLKEFAETLNNYEQFIEQFVTESMKKPNDKNDKYDDKEKLLQLRDNVHSAYKMRAPKSEVQECENIYETYAKYYKHVYGYVPYNLNYMLQTEYHS